MAGVAIERGVRAEEREPVLVIVDLLDRDIPSVDGVALLATGAKLPLMDVGMTVGALIPNVGENGFHVTLRAGNVLVQAAQRKLGLIVVELGDGADRLPAFRGMTILTREVQIPVRASRVGLRLRTGKCSAREAQHSNSKNQVHRAL